MALAGGLGSTYYTAILSLGFFLVVFAMILPKLRKKVFHGLILLRILKCASKSIMVGIWLGGTYENAPETNPDFCIYSGANTEWTRVFRDLSILKPKCEEYSGDHFH